MRPLPVSCRALGLVLVLALTCVSVTACAKKDAPVAATVAPAATIAITVDEDGFKPDLVNVKKGVPATLVFTRTSDDTCATAVVFPQLDIKKELPKGQAVAISVPTDKEQTLTFECGMGMYKSSVVVGAN